MSVTELDVAPEPEVMPAGDTDLTLTVVDPDGESVADATVVVSGGTATLDGVVTDKTGDDGSVDVDVDPSLGPNQDEGTIEIDIKPPASGGYTDRRANTDVLVLAD